MIQPLVFSRDRPAQLDLLLRSIRTNARWVGPITVLYTYSAAHYADGYSAMGVRSDVQRVFH